MWSRRTRSASPISGRWTNNNTTPLQRPAAWAGKAVLTDAELEQLKTARQKLEEDGDALFGDELILDAIDGDAGTGVARHRDRQLQQVLAAAA